MYPLEYKCLANVLVSGPSGGVLQKDLLGDSKTYHASFSQSPTVPNAKLKITAEDFPSSTQRFFGLKTSLYWPLPGR